MAQRHTQSPASRIENLPASIFSIVMGLTGYAIAVQKATPLGLVPTPFAQAALWFSSIVFAALLVAYATKLARYMHAVVQEFAHPIKRNFIPAISISFILQSIAYAGTSSVVAFWLLAIGATLQFGLMLGIVRQWLWHDNIQPQHLNPAWFIPAVGNMLVPVSAMHFSYTGLSWFFFSVGFMFWIVLLAAYFYRSFFHEQLPLKLQPTQAILIAPPAVIVIALSKLLGNPSPLLTIAYSLSLFFLALLLTRVVSFARLPFFLSWWAYSFPLASVTIATIVMNIYAPSPLLVAGIATLLVALTALIGMLIYRTVRAVLARAICVAE
ncbi:C4-dicarboxylate ABC transporter [Candidatus Saccharibacteria bacterium]|nr:C4-dicarboxylate ABC transporter [Candidatus Saccharibacteria bacterium]